MTLMLMICERILDIQSVTLHTNVEEIKYEIFCYKVPKTVEV